MRKLVLITFLLFTYVWQAQAQEASGNKGAASPDVVVKAVRAYNEKDLDAYLACFSPDVEVFNSSGVLMYQGREKLKEALEVFWQTNPKARRQVIDRVNSGQKIVEREKVTGLKGAPEHSVTSVYELENGLIKSFFFIGEF